jgi:hypothetical protein
MPMGGPTVIPPALSPEQEKTLLERQRALQEKASNLIGHRVELLEDENFILMSDLPGSSRKQMLQWLKALYLHLDRIFAVSRENMRLWDGKLLVVVLARRQDYQRFASVITRAGGVAFAEGYFQPQFERSSGAMTASVVLPVPADEKRAVARLQSALVHECAHAFLYFWGRPGRTPLWLHEGTALHMQAVARPDDPGVKAFRRAAHKLAEDDEGQPIELAAEGLMPASAEDGLGYAQALAMTETLLAADPKRYVRFVKAMKEGTPQKQALEQAFGWSYHTFDVQWRRFARKEY